VQAEIDSHEMEDFCGTSCTTALRKSVQLKPLPSRPGVLPSNACVDAAMAESSLGWNINDEIDDDMLDSVDADTKAEEECLRGVVLNPPGLDYTCFAPEISLMDPQDAASVGLDGGVHTLDKQTFKGDADAFQKTLVKSLEQQKLRFQRILPDATEHTRKVSELDPTQARVYTTIKSWAQQDAVSAPLRLLVLGTAGTGKTFTLKCAVEAARAIFKSFDSVLMVAHTGLQRLTWEVVQELYTQSSSLQATTWKKIWMVIV
jgi:hypothetical protein